LYVSNGIFTWATDTCAKQHVSRTANRKVRFLLLMAAQIITICGKIASS
jgi:hypothetical protein